MSDFLSRPLAPCKLPWYIHNRVHVWKGLLTHIWEDMRVSQPLPGSQPHLEPHEMVSYGSWVSLRCGSMQHGGPTGHGALSLPSHPLHIGLHTQHCELSPPKVPDDTAIVGCGSEGNKQEYREVINDFVNWCECSHLHINKSKTKEMMINFQRKTPQITPVNIQGLDLEMVVT